MPLLHSLITDTGPYLGSMAQTNPGLHGRAQSPAEGWGGVGTKVHSSQPKWF